MFGFGYLSEKDETKCFLCNDLENIPPVDSGWVLLCEHMVNKFQQLPWNIFNIVWKYENSDESLKEFDWKHIR